MAVPTEKKLPIDMLGGITCPNSKTISRHELENRVLAAFPDSLFSHANIERVQDSVTKSLAQSAKQESKSRELLIANIKKIEQQQRGLMEQLAQRAAESRPAIAAFNDLIDNQEAERAKLQADLNALPVTPASIEAPVISVPPYRVVITALIANVKHKTDDELDPWIHFTRQLIQKVVISPSLMA